MIPASELFGRDYFNGGHIRGGYSGSGYADFVCHWTTARKILDLKPESVLELGCARGYILKRLEAAGVRCKGLEVSRHCFLTRATNAVTTWDITKTPWPVEDGEFDLAISTAVLEHIPEASLPSVMAELARTCKRGLHGIDITDDGHDETHFTIKPLPYWLERMPPGQVPVDKEDLERGPVTVPGGTGVKLNVGSFTTMFHHGWINVDQHDLGAWARQHGYRFTRHDLRAPLWLDDGIADLVYCSHTLEHFDYAQGAAVLADFRRVLKPGGVCRIIVPDARRLIAKGLEGTLGDFDEVSPTAAAHSTQAGKLWELLMGGGHASIYDVETLCNAMVTAGFSHVEARGVFSSLSPVMQRETWDMFPDLSLVVEGVK